MLEKLLITCLYDVATKTYGKLMLHENQEIAQRSFSILMESQHLEKYSDKIFLYILGEYNIQTGQIDLYKNRIICNYSGSVKKEDKEIKSEYIEN